MTLAELDEVLRVWKARLASIAENLLDLQSTAAYQSLTGSGGLEKIAVTGTTAARIKPALGAMHTMFEQFGLLQSTVDQAEALRRQLPAFFGGEAKAREIERLLFGRSIQLPAVEIPLEQRTLLGGIRSFEQMTPEEVLAPMERTFAAARDAVMSADRAWTEFGENSARLEQAIASLRGQRALPSALLESAFADAQARLEAVRAHVATDPLGAEGQLRSEVEPALAAITQRIEVALQLAAQLRAAAARCAEMLHTHGEARAAVDEALGKVATGIADTELSAADRLQGLQAWLTRLERKREEGAVEAVAIGLRHWNAAAEACVLQDRAVLRLVRERMEQRSELRGRFDALKAKARRFGIAESDGLATLGSQAEALLYTRPTDLAGAAAAVARYEQRLSLRERGVPS